jgi:hypothetical protein
MSTDDVNLNTTLFIQKSSLDSKALTDSSSTTTKTYQSNALGYGTAKPFAITKRPKLISKVNLEQAEQDTLHEDLSDDAVKLNPNSLISISREVLKYLEETRCTKGTDVTKHILLQLNVSQDDLSFKNIQRRVYDAINVMNAIGILHKDKNNLFYKGHTNFKKLFNKTGVPRRNSVLKDKLNYKAQRINAKQQELMALSLKVILINLSTIYLKNSNWSIIPTLRESSPARGWIIHSTLLNLSLMLRL